MIWIEFAGLVGSGKTSLVREVQSRLEAQSLSAGSTKAGSQRSSGPGSRFSAGIRRLQAFGYQLGFSAKHFDLIRRVYSSSPARDGLPAWHRRRILRLFFNLAGRYEESMRGQVTSPVLIDEGFTHRAVNLFAWQEGIFNPVWAREYFKHLPTITRVFLVSIPWEESLARAYQRGLPEPLQGKSEAVVRLFMQNSERIFNIAQEVFQHTGQAYSIVENRDKLEITADRVYEELLPFISIQRSHQSATGPFVRANQSRIAQR